MEIKAVKFRRDGFYTQPFVFGGEELIPEANEGEHSNLSTIGFAIGFVLMMVLDVVMG